MSTSAELRSGVAGMIRSESNASVVNPVSVTLTGIPYATYDVLVYVGFLEPGNLGFVQQNGDVSSRRYFVCASMPPFHGFTEITAASAAEQKPGNFVRYRNLTGTTQTISAQSTELQPVCVHGCPNARLP